MLYTDQSIANQSYVHAAVTKELSVMDDGIDVSEPVTAVHLPDASAEFVM